MPEPEKIASQKNAQPPAQTTALQDHVNGACTLIVWERAVNPHILICHAEDAPQKLALSHLLRVRVRDNANFIRGMKVPATRISDDYYECSAPPPRARGRW
jgi:hypothetical protein